jgi:hypothetical protein
MRVLIYKALASAPMTCAVIAFLSHLEMTMQRSLADELLVLSNEEKGLMTALSHYIK